MLLAWLYIIFYNDSDIIEQVIALSVWLETIFILFLYFIINTV